LISQSPSDPDNELTELPTLMPRCSNQFPSLQDYVTQVLKIDHATRTTSTDLTTEIDRRLPRAMGIDKGLLLNVWQPVSDTQERLASAVKPRAQQVV
jgi:hypothetical protein